MNKVIEFKVSDPWDYKAPLDRAQILELPSRRFASISGEGDPNGADFTAAMTALYGFSYAVRMSYRSPNPPAGCGAYVVGVLQGRWDLRPGATVFDIHHKDNLAWTVMIRQPEFLNSELFTQFLDQSRAKAAKKDQTSLEWFDRLQFESREGGSFGQIMHIGPYDDEPASFARLEADLTKQGRSRLGKYHWEVYLGDPRKTAPEKLKTILRVSLVP